MGSALQDGKFQVKIDRLKIAWTEGGLELFEFKALKNPLIVQKTVLEQELAKIRRGEAGTIEPPNLFTDANRFVQKTL